ncbi:YicC family protein [Desulfuribacillus stibiiarsenatis]|uniref:YicC family protein n=1 Tax=Desulfuribacillus stibiiarsenatis TaxID=1390249 RepID=A0A1E5L6H7_9FIRM|nr:YicC/YloC family endoribonuclease [Desulfuribacillus stibiiarsenatis]OEH85745.1 YicC family protein [Desulfuribacillus stibiiarsenatis]
MLKSMTGYGRSTQSFLGYSVTVEMKAVNHRYKEVVIRMPRDIISLEEPIKKRIGDRVKRGRVDVFITIEQDKGLQESIQINPDIIAAYIIAAKKIAEEHPDVKNDLSILDIMRLPDAVSVKKFEISVDEFAEPLGLLVEQALVELLEFRKNEGISLEQDFQNRLAVTEEYVSSIETTILSSITEYTDKLRKRLNELLVDINIDEDRLALEVVIFADRTNIDEELTRLKSHIYQFRKFLKEEDAIGRKLDFLVQEMNREINTIGSKANHIDLSNYVIEVKSELEKIREQVQNVE